MPKHSNIQLKRCCCVIFKIHSILFFEVHSNVNVFTSPIQLVHSFLNFFFFFAKISFQLSLSLSLSRAFARFYATTIQHFISVRHYSNLHTVSINQITVTIIIIINNQLFPCTLKNVRVCECVCTLHVFVYVSN